MGLLFSGYGSQICIVMLGNLRAGFDIEVQLTSTQLGSGLNRRECWWYLIEAGGYTPLALLFCLIHLV